jgi:hypothetical protein
MEVVADVTVLVSAVVVRYAAVPSVKSVRATCSSEPSAQVTEMVAGARSSRSIPVIVKVQAVMSQVVDGEVATIGRVGAFPALAEAWATPLADAAAAEA